jgi:imidazolonepropionase
VRIWQDANLVTVADGTARVIPDAAIAVLGERIVFVGPRAELPVEAGAETLSLGGRLVTPALIDCHTHLVHGGHRAREFEMRLAGASYEEVARAGGGIVSTVSATRALDVDGMVAMALPRLDTLLAEGVATVEIKSGYGLSIASELDMLRAARRLAALRPVRIVTSYLAAHAVPAEYRGRADNYVSEVVLPGMRQGHAEGLIDAVDGFCEGIAFSPAQMERVFDLAAELGLPVKLHAEQLSNLGGAALVARYRGLSTDHLEYLDDAGIAAMAASGTVAVLLPGAFYTLKETRKPPVSALRAASVPMAVATDCNPGTSPLTSMLLAMNMAATLFGLTVDECLAGATRHAARALGLGDEAGTLEAGKRADMAVWDVETPAELIYRLGFNPLHARIWRGERTL